MGPSTSYVTAAAPCLDGRETSRFPAQGRDHRLRTLHPTTATASPIFGASLVFALVDHFRRVRNYSGVVSSVPDYVG